MFIYLHVIEQHNNKISFSGVGAVGGSSLLVFIILTITCVVMYVFKHSLMPNLNFNQSTYRFEKVVIYTYSEKCL